MPKATTDPQEMAWLYWVLKVCGGISSVYTAPAFILVLFFVLKDYNPETGIRKYANCEILLPKENRFCPAISSLYAQRTKFGFA